MLKFRIFCLSFLLINFVCSYSNSEPFFSAENNLISSLKNDVGSDVSKLNYNIADNSSDYLDSLGSYDQNTSNNITESKENASNLQDSNVLIKIEQIEAQNRLLTGRIEELEHNAEKYTEKLKELEELINMKQPGFAGNKINFEQELNLDNKDVSSDKAASDESYKKALSFIRKGDYKAANKELENFIKYSKDSDMLSNAYYWFGETYYVEGDYKKAALNYLEGYKLSPYSHKAIDNLSKLGISLLNLEKYTDSCSVFNKLLSEFPNLSLSKKKEISVNRSKAGC